MRKTKEGMLEVIKELEAEFASKSRGLWYDRDRKAVYGELCEKLDELKTLIENDEYEWL